jgi:hypothetical protein
MLYDPKWEVKAEPRSLESLVAWLEKQPPEKSYSFLEPSTCLVAQWLISNGETNYCLFSEEIEAMFGGRGLEIVDGIGPAGEWTFGAALKRARAAAKRPVAVTDCEG